MKLWLDGLFVSVFASWLSSVQHCVVVLLCWLFLVFLLFVVCCICGLYVSLGVVCFVSGICSLSLYVVCF